MPCNFIITRFIIAQICLKQGRSMTSTSYTSPLRSALTTLSVMHSIRNLQTSVIMKFRCIHISSKENIHVTVVILPFLNCCCHFAGVEVGNTRHTRWRWKQSSTRRPRYSTRFIFRMTPMKRLKSTRAPEPKISVRTSPIDSI